MYSFDFGGMKIRTLGLLSEEIDAKASEELSGKDILFVPIGDGLLDASVAYKKAVSLEPKIIIPVGDVDPKSESLKVFVFLVKEGFFLKCDGSFKCDSGI